ncbi:MAG: heme-binding protein, partial [Candidatus Thioglobus sp.]|nr:heme-binding protein [Candidatus Thioglobus sp.]
KAFQKKFVKLLQLNNIETQGGFMVAQFNAPYVPPIFRKNELMVRIK